MTKKKTKSTGKGPIRIEWLDHCSLQGGWKHASDADKLTPATVLTVGWVVKETKKYITVASIWSEDYMVQGEICIMKNCIVKRTKF